VADVLDVNGDWLPDRVTTKDDKSPWKIYFSNAGAGPDVAVKPELLTRVENGLGGSLTLGYASSASFRDPSGALANPALPSPVIALASSVLDDGRGTQSETRFHYAGGAYDPASREFRGFARVTVTGPPVAGPEGPVRLVSETDFHQDDQRKGLVAETRAHQMTGEAASLLYRETTSYHPDAAPPYERLVAETRSLTHDGNPAARVRKVVHAAYQDGSPTEVRDLGEVLDEADPFHDGTNDELITRIEYADSGPAHLLGLPSHVTVTAGDPGAKQAERWFLYDGLPPGQALRGDRTRAEAWLHDPTDGFTATVASTVAYDAFGNAVAATDPNGHTTTTVFDTAYHTFPVATILPPLAPDAAGFVTARTFDPAFGRPLTSTDLNGHQGRSALDALGRETATYLAPAGAAEIPLTETAYNDSLLGAPDDGGAGGPSAQHVTLTRFVRQGSGEAIVSRAFFDGLGRVYRRETPGDQGRAVVTTLSFDAAGGASASTAPHFAGDPPLTTAWTRDALGRPVRAANPDGTTLDVIHDRWTSTEELFSPAGASLRKKTTRHDAAGRIVRVEEWNATDPGGDPGPYPTAYAYDPRGNLALVVDPLGNATAYVHDTLNRKVAMTDPDTGSWRYAYDHAGRLTRQVDGRGIAVTLEYDALDRLVARRSPDGEATFTYDGMGGIPIPGGIGRLVRASAPAIAVDLSYDAFGNVAETQYLNAGAVHRMRRVYDLLGRETSATYPDGETVSRAYEGPALKRITSASAPGGHYLRDATYDAFGRPRSLLLGNSASLTYQYDAGTARLLALQGASPVAGAVLDLEYVFSPHGHLVSIADRIDPARSETFAHDALGRLVSAQGGYGAQAFRYDPIGNLVQKGEMALDYAGGSGSTGGPHAVKAAGSQTFAYDAGGNMTRMGSRALDYGAEGRLAAVREGNVTLARFHYDAFGRRWKHDGGASPQQWSFGDDFDWDGQHGTKTIRAGGRIIAYRTAPYQGAYGSGCAGIGSAGAPGAAGLGDLAVYALLLGILALLRAASRIAWPARAFARAGGIALLIAAHLHATAPRTLALPVHADGSVHAGTLFPLGNHLGSTAALLDEAGALVRRIHYDPWGAVSASTGSVELERKFTAQRLDGEIGLYHYGSRPYHPGIGRFVQPDPVVPDPTSSRGLNRYAYVYNDPLGYTDPGGNFPFIPIIIGAILGGIAAHQQGGNVFLGALFGGLSGGLGAGVAGIFGGGLAGGIAGGAVAGFVGGGLQSALAGGSFLQGALSGALGGALGGSVPTVAGWNIDGFGLEDVLNPLHKLLATVTNAAFRGAFGGAGLIRRGLDAITFRGYSAAFNAFQEVWNYPNNLVGDWYAGQLGATSTGKHDGIKIYMTDKLGRGVNAAVIGRRMFLKPSGVTPAVFEHEMGHVMQSNLLGPLVFPAFLGSELVGRALGLATALSHGRGNFSDNFLYASYAYSYHEQILINRGAWFPTMLEN
jgi:RHS repeat-associated protein